MISFKLSEILLIVLGPLLLHRKMAPGGLGSQDGGALAQKSEMLLLPTAAHTHVSKSTRAALPISTPLTWVPLHLGAALDVHLKQISPD